jgi:aspartate aminotransferase-like enzyme
MDSGFALLGSAGNSSPAVISIVLPEHLSSLRIGEAMERRGWLLSYLSGYLLDRNSIQICLMGSVTEEQCEQMMKAFAGIAAPVE